MKKFFLLMLGAALLSACSQKFEVKGSIAGAEANACVYLEQVGVASINMVDSARLGKTGEFSFKAERPAYPDLYRLRIGNRTLLLAVDSIEKIGVKADMSDMLAAEFENSPKSEAILALRRSLRDNTLPAHKAFAVEQILAEPKSIVAYYAVMQMKNGQPVFSLIDKADQKYYRAVATSWQVWMPECERTKVLCKQVLDQMNADRVQQNVAAMRAFIEENDNTFLDIKLQNELGDSISLSQFKGKPILLDFCSTDIENYRDYLFSLRDRYNAYHAKGLEIYQVYPDQNRLLWEDKVRELPWTTVRTQLGAADPVYTTYNVQALPTIYLINKQGEVVGRYIGFNKIDEGIEAIL